MVSDVMGRCLFVTCGATVGFEALVESVLDKQVLELAVEHGYSRVIIQFGKGNAAHFEAIIDDLDGVEASGSKNGIKIEEFDSKKVLQFKREADGFEIYGMEYLGNIQDVIKNHADVVISHAGTGSILDALRLNKPLIVCVNDKLMDNHQADIAAKFESQNYVVAATPTVTSLCTCLTKIETEKLDPFSCAWNPKFEHFLIDTANTY